MKNLGNTINLTNLFEVGEIIFLEENSDFAFEVVSPYNVKPLFGESVKPVKLATGVKNALKEITGVSPTHFKPAELVVNSENLTLVEVGELRNISVPNNIKKSNTTENVLEKRVVFRIGKYAFEERKTNICVLTLNQAWKH